MLRPHPIPCLSLALAVLAAPAAAQNSQISLDGSLNGRMDVLTGDGTGPNYTISEDMGRRSGNGANLFHSFKDFSIGTGHSASFTANSGEPALSNVITRVTGGQPSEINGRLVLDRATIPDADFYLLNPRGVLFGGQSSIDVPGSFYVSTAHQLAFEQGAPLDLLSTAAPEVLNSAPPAAFGFFASGPRAEVVFSNPLPQTGTRDYAVAAGRTFSAVAGDVRVENNVTLRAPSGRVQLAAVGGSAAQVPRDLAVPLAQLGALGGEVRVAGGAQVLAANATRSAPQGSVVIRGGRFELARCAEPCTPTSFEAGSIVRAGGVTGTDGPSIDVAVSGGVAIHGASTLLRSEAQVNQSGGVRIEADRILVADGALVQTQASLGGAGGDLTLAAREIRVAEGGIAGSLTARDGRGGRVLLQGRGGSRAERVEIEGGEVQSFAGSPGTGGDIRVASDVLRVVDGKLASVSSGTGPSGSIEIDADRIEVRGGLAQVSTLNRIATAPEPTLPGGAIRIGSAAQPASAVVIADGGLVSTETSGAQPGGAIHVFAESLDVTGGSAARPSALQTATSSTSASGVGGFITLEVGSLRVGASEPGGVPGIVAAFVASGASAAGGTIEITGGSALIEDGGQVFTTTQGAGQAGAIDLELTGEFVARGSRVDGGLKPSGLFARGEVGSSGNAGNIRVSADAIEILDAAEISSQAEGSGNSGDIGLFASDRIRIDGGLQASSVIARGVAGRAGNVTLAGRSEAGVQSRVDRVEILDGGLVDVSVNGAGDGGLLRVYADELRVSGRSGTGIASSLGAETAGSGDAQGIDVDVRGLVRVENEGEINSITRFGGGQPGDIVVRAATIEFVGGEGTAASEAGDAGAGSIRLEASESIRVLDGAELTVRSADGQDAGTLTLVSPDIEIRRSGLTADADGFGGNIEITSDSLLLEKSSIEAFSRGVDAGGPGALVSLPTGDTPAGGNITIEGGAVVLNQARLVADGFDNANGGFIDITADPWLRSGDSAITASSEFGLDGFVLVNTPYGEVTGDLAALPETFLDASRLLEEPCLARDAPSGSFAVQRLPRVAPPPDAPLSAEPAEAQCEAPPAP